MRIPRSECTSVRVAVFHPISRPHKQRRCSHCFVFLEDDAIADSPGDRASAAPQDSHRSYISSTNDPLLLKGALTDAQLQEAVTQVIGPAGFSASEANDGFDEEDDAEEDAAASYSDVWGDAAVNEGMLPYQELGRLIDGPVSEEAGRADVRALEAMHTRLRQSQSSEAQSDSLSEVSDEAISFEDAEEVQPVQEEAVLLPEIQLPEHYRQHRRSNDTSAFLGAMTESAKFLDRWAVFSQQLHSWGYQGACNHLC